MKFIKLAFLVFTFALAGCVSWGVGSVDGYPTTKIRFVDLNEKKVMNTWVELYDNEQSTCIAKHEGISVAVLNGIALDHGRKDLNMPLGETFSKDYKTEILSRADKPLIFRMGYNKQGGYIDTGYAVGELSSSNCLVALKFSPKADHLYEMTYRINGSQCESQIFELVNNPQTRSYERVLEPSARKVECKK